MKGFFEKEDFIFSTRVKQKIGYKENNLFEIEKIADKATLIMNEFEERLSFFKENSEVNILNKSASKGFTRVSVDTFEILKKSSYYSKLTNGIFDITIAPLVKEWAINSNKPNILSNNRVKELLSLVDYEDVILNEVNSSVMLLREKQKIDLGGIAKGYIADRIADYLKAENVTSALINLGGNILTFGPALHNPDQKWRIGIQNPKETRNTNLLVLAIRDQSVVTSGIYERTFEIDGKTYHHIFDSQTGYPVSSDLASLTIISSLSVDGEIWTTRLFGPSLERIFQEVSSQPNLEAIIVDKDNHCFQTAGIYKIRLS